MKEVLITEHKLSANEIASAYEIQKSREVLIPLPFMQTGHKMWEIKRLGDTIIIDEADLTESQAHFNDKNKQAIKFIVVKPGCQYIGSLNEDNALKRYCKANKIPFKHKKNKKCSSK